MSDIFISYSRSDLTFAKQITNELKKQDKDVWIDWEDIPRASDWLNEIFSGIEGADAFVFIVTPRSLTSQICQYELHRAFQCNKRIVPVIRENVTNKNELNSDVSDVWLSEKNRDWGQIANENWAALKRLNWIFFDNDAAFEDEFKALLEAATTDLEHLKLHTRLLVRARDWEQSSNNPSSLLVGDEIAAAEKWLATSTTEHKQPVPVTLHYEFIQASRAAENERETRLRQLRRVSRIATGISSIAFVATLVLGGVAWNTGNLLNQVPPTLTAVAGLASLFSSVAGEEGNEAVRLLNLARDEMEAQPDVAALLAIRSLNAVYSPQGDKVLVEAVSRLGTQIVLSHETEVARAKFSPDDQRVITDSNDRSFLWNARTSEQLATFESYGEFSSDGRYFLPNQYPNGDKRFPLYNGSSGQLLRYLRPDAKPIIDEDLSVAVFTDEDLVNIQDGERDEEGTVRATIDNLYNPETGELISSVPFVSKDIYRQTADGRYVVQRAELDNDRYTIRLLDMESSAEILQLTLAQGDRVNFSPQGRFLIVETSADTIEIYDTVTGELTANIRFTDIYTLDVAVSLDDTRLATSTLPKSGDPIVQMWDLTTGELLYEIPKDIASKSEWAGFSGVLEVLGGIVIQFTPDSQFLITSTYIWNMSTQQPEYVLSNLESELITDVTKQLDFLLIRGIDESNENQVYVRPIKWSVENEQAQRDERTYEEYVSFVCANLGRDFTAQEREQFGIVGTAATCVTAQSQSGATLTP